MFQLLPNSLNFILILSVFSMFRPGLLNGCKMLNKTWDSLQISCRMSESQHKITEDYFTYVATVIDQSSNNSSRVIRFRRPEFNISQLQPATHYSIQLHAENTIGSGPIITLLADTYSLGKDPENYLNNFEGNRFFLKYLLFLKSISELFL